MSDISAEQTTATGCPPWWTPVRGAFDRPPAGGKAKQNLNLPEHGKGASSGIDGRSSRYERPPLAATAQGHKENLPNGARAERIRLQTAVPARYAKQAPSNGREIIDYVWTTARTSTKLMIRSAEISCSTPAGHM
jgi:hypothetical protein